MSNSYFKYIKINIKRNIDLKKKLINLGQQHRLLLTWDNSIGYGQNKCKKKINYLHERFF